MEKDIQMVEEIKDDVLEAADNNSEEEVTAAPEVIPSMDEFKDEIERSFKRLREGDMITGPVIGVGDDSVTVDLGSYTEGIIPIDELSNDPRFSIKADIAVGETVSAVVISEDNGEGAVLLSLKRAADILAWEGLKADLQSKTVFQVKVAEAVKGGVVTYLKGIRAFIPGSQLGLSYVEDLSTYVGQVVEVVVITAEEENKKLVLSAREVARGRAAEEKAGKISNLQAGLVVEGTVEKIESYGAFVNIGNGLTGLVHISQICGRRIKTPNEIVKTGETVKVKIMEVKDGKIRLSMKEASEQEEIADLESDPIEYESGEAATTGLAALLSGIKLD